MKSLEEPVVTPILSAETLGALVRSRRRASGLTQAQAAGLAGVGNRFLSELERGKKTVSLALVLQVLERLGFELIVAPRGTLARRAQRRISPSPPRATKKKGGRVRRG